MPNDPDNDPLIAHNCSRWCCAGAAGRLILSRSCRLGSGGRCASWDSAQLQPASGPDVPAPSSAPPLANQVGGIEVDLQSVQSYVRASLRRWRECEQVGPFLASFSGTSRNPFLNYAIPEDDAQPTEAEAQALIDTYRKRGLRPRLEYIPELAPAVEPVLKSRGFRPEGRLALMEYDPEPLRRFEVLGIELLTPSSEEELLGLRQVQHAAYLEPEPARPEDVASLRRNLAAGGGAVLARTTPGELAVGAGEFTPISEGVTEITSIGVLEAFRRRGIASAMTDWLVRAATEAGAIHPFLMANQAEERIYAGVGFRTGGQILHISIPD